MLVFIFDAYMTRKLFNLVSSKLSTVAIPLDRLTCRSIIVQLMFRASYRCMGERQRQKCNERKKEREKEKEHE